MISTLKVLSRLKVDWVGGEGADRNDVCDSESMVHSSYRARPLLKDLCPRCFSASEPYLSVPDVLSVHFP